MVDASSQLSAVFTEGCGCQRRARRRRLTLPTPRRWQGQPRQRPRGVQFSLHVNMYSRYEDRDCPGTTNLPRPERLDTVAEVSEPPSESVHSLPHDGVRWPEQPNQHTSLNTEQLNSLNSLDLTSIQTEKKEMFSQAEIEFRNSDRDARKLVSNNIKYEK